jgi:MAP3K TRAFs-binding domain
MPTCFVVMGFGLKTDYTKPKTFNLDKTYRNIIKPAAIAAGFDCVRADEILQSGNINVPMYDQLLNADVVVADLSTYNCNAFYELGIRHALRPYTTIVISEDGLNFPFDVAQIAVQRYHHLGEGIDSEEVDRMRSELALAMKTIAEKKNPDSPVYTFVKNLTPPVIAAAVAAIAEAVSSPAAGSAAPAAAPASNPTISVLMGQAEQAMESNNFIVAKALLTELRRMMPDELWVTHKLVLATYKSKLPTEQAALQEACDLLAGLNARDSTDTETLGLVQAVHKRLWNLTQNRVHLDKAIWSSEKGFYLKNDYYNGINLAFLYNVRASQSEGVEAVADFVLAQRTRRRVVTVCEELLQAGRLERDPAYWLLATLAEAYVGLGDEARSQDYLQKAEALQPAPAAWMLDSTRDQLQKLRQLIATPPVQAV